MALKQIEPVVERIGGNSFYITPFPAFKAANLTGELASLLAPLLGAIAPLINSDEEGNGEEEKKSTSLMDIDASDAAQAMMNCPAIEGDKVEKLMKKLLLGGHIVVEYHKEDGNVDHERLDLDLANEIFCGDVQDMFILCFYVIRLNFKGFFKKFATLSGRAGSAEEKEPRKVL